MKNRISILIILLILLSLFAYSEDRGDLSFSITPGGNLPLGESASYFKPGGGAGLSTALSLSSLPLLSVKADLGYRYMPIRTKDGISIFSAGGGLGINLTPIKKLTMSAYSTGGYYYGILTDGSGAGGGNIYIQGGLSAYYSFLPSFSLGLDVHYVNNLSLYSGLGFSLGTAFHIPLKKTARIKTEKALPEKPEPLETKPAKKTGEGLDVSEISFEHVFPVLFKYYDTRPVGKVVLHNWETVPISGISLSFFVERYMDNPKQCKTPDKLDGGEEAEVDLYALFSDSVLEITEGTKVSARITLEYTLKGESYSREYVETLRMYDRNALTWDDDRKAAAFVTAKDPIVLEFAKNVAVWIKGKASKTINTNLSLALGLHEALRLYGITYVIDPTTPYAEFSKDKLSVDFLQFPQQTLRYSSGDCDDLSILYSALLESVGIETAFITTPGHIFMAFSLDMPPEEARKYFLSADELVLRDDKSWVPVEVTQIQRNFLEAWQAGAKEWRENSAREQAGFYPMHKSWLVYEPVGFLSGRSEITLPQKARVVKVYLEEITKFIEREIEPRVSKLQEQIIKNNNSPKYINKIGVLYARYGSLDKAMDQFNSILNKQEYVPALINMGNIYYLNNEMEKALEYYKRASAEAPDNPKVLLCVARVNHELENYKQVKRSYDKLKLIDPDLADQFAYLEIRGEEASRSAEMSAVKEVVLWDEE